MSLTARSGAGYDTRQAGRDVASLGQERQFNRGKKQEGEWALGHKASPSPERGRSRGEGGWEGVGTGGGSL